MRVLACQNMASGLRCPTNSTHRKSESALHYHFWRTCGSTARPRWSRFTQSVPPDILADSLRNTTGPPILVGRLGNVESEACVHLDDGVHVDDSRKGLSHAAGVSGLNSTGLLAFVAEYAQAARDSDAMQLVGKQCREHLEFMCHFKVAPQAFIYYNESLSYWRDLMQALAIRKTRLLVVSPFVDTIAAHLPRLSRIHPDHNLTGLEVRLLRTPQSFGWAADVASRRDDGARQRQWAVPSAEGERVSPKDWLHSFTQLKASAEWDADRSEVALLGCGGYGMPLAAHAKRRGMSAIYAGGLLQSLFGIRGGRWVTRAEYRADNGMKCVLEPRVALASPDSSAIAAHQCSCRARLREIALLLTTVFPPARAQSTLGGRAAA